MRANTSATEERIGSGSVLEDDGMKLCYVRRSTCKTRGESKLGTQREHRKEEKNTINLYLRQLRCAQDSISAP
jgi:hypothetical protein